jgi:hypothetical protein
VSSGGIFCRRLLLVLRPYADADRDRTESIQDGADVTGERRAARRRTAVLRLTTQPLASAAMKSIRLDRAFMFAYALARPDVLAADMPAVVS